MWPSDWYDPWETDWSQRWAHKGRQEISLPFSDSIHRKWCSGEGWGPLTPPAFLCRPSGALCCPALAIAKAVGRSGDGLLQLFPLPLASYTFSGHLLVLAQSKCLGRVSSGGDKVW